MHNRTPKLSSYVTLPLLAFGLIAALPALAQTVDTPPAKAANKIVFTPDMLIGPCPVERLRKAYKGLLQEQDTFNLSAVDQEVILICTERQKIVNDYVESLHKTASLLEGMSRLSVSKQTYEPNGVTLGDVTSALSSAAWGATAQSTTPEPDSGHDTPWRFLGHKRTKEEHFCVSENICFPTPLLAMRFRTQFQRKKYAEIPVGMV